MAHDITLISTLAGGLGTALGFGYLANRVGLSPIVGYLLAGVVVGPYTPGFVADKHLAEQMAGVGVVLLMFGVGLHFHIEELLAVRRIAVPGAVGQSAAATLLGALVGVAFGWGWAAGIVFGLALSVASTVVLTRVLADNDALHTQTGHIAVGWLVVEDLLTVLVLVVLPVVFGPPGGPALPIALALAVVKIALLVALTFPVGGRVIPWVLGKVAKTGSRELFTLAVLAVALGIAVGAVKGFGVSMELGAFLAGMVVGRTEFSLRAASDALPMRDAFAVLFFVSVGMQFDPASLVRMPALIAATVGVVLLGKPLAAAGLVLVLGYPMKVALSVAVALGQIGEFSFILAAVGVSLKVLPAEATSALVAAAIASITVNQLLYKAVGPTEEWLRKRPKLWKALTARERKPDQVPPAEADADPRFRAVVVGYGPVGRTLCRLLRENGITPTVVEMNLETVRALTAEGTAAVYGDAAHADTLKAAGVATADTLVLSTSGIAAAELVRAARELNPDVRVLARSVYLRERADLYRAGADVVYAGEGEVALAMAESVLRGLGATPDQIDRERERVRAELFGTEPPEMG